MSQYKIGDYDLKQIQDVMLQMMIEVDRVCRKNNIRYVLNGGTMLGAVRHHGFIPWDDDVDLALPREDYDKFVKIANSELPEEFRLECYENTREYPYNLGKVRAINTLFKEKFTASLNINHGIFIDIVPMDYICTSDYRNRVKLIQHLTAIKYYKLGLFNLNGFFHNLKYAPFFGISVKTLNKMIDKQLRYHHGKSDKLLEICHYYFKTDFVLDKTMFTDVIEVPFEGYMFFIPRDYDSFLKARYGDYMTPPPIENQKPCHDIVEVQL